MYNFAGETKDIFRDILSIIRYNIDRFSVQANLACKHAGINAIDLGEAYQRAIKCIRDNYEALNNLDKCYCFTLGSIVRGDMYETSFATYYTNKGNHPTFHASLSTNRIIDIDPFGMRMVIDANLNDLIILSSSDHLRILTRYKILPRNEEEKEMTYYDYLYKVGVINYTTTKIYNRLIELNWMKKQDATFMSEYKIRDLVSGDNIDLVCNEAGNPGGSYFNVGWKGKYRNQDNKREAQYWSGKIAEATFLDINNGSQVNNKNLAVYATYAENHTLWINDEYWSFVGTNNLHFYFMLTVVK